MDRRIAALAGEQAGTFSAAEARIRGIDAGMVRRALRDGELIRVRRGAFVSGQYWEAADPDSRYRLAVMAVARTRPGDAVSHHSAFAVRGLPLWGYNARRIDMLSDVEQAVGRSGLWIHPRGLVRPEVVDGIPVEPIARSVVRTALTMGLKCAVVAGDAALHAGLVTHAQLVDEVARLTPHEGRSRALDAVLRMNGASESVGESLTRLVLDDLGLTYECQVLIREPSGEVVARVDFMVEGVVLEFDGRVKYQRARDPGEGQAADPEQVLWLEKQREDRIRRLGHPVERAIWDDLDRPGLLGARIRSARPHNTPSSRKP
ncbi:hypothetical protein GCM10027053_53070 [Intrasporangium mesophilum]